MTGRCQKESALPKSPLPVRPFLIKYMAQDRGPELENAPGFMLQSWVQKQQQLGPNFQQPEGREKKASKEQIIIRTGETAKGKRERMGRKRK
ncbi:runt-related transcription factor 1-like protein [Lates japonicus]|uniref:Runt-related transcription factor 1-like protein n=1 Tax=Lates japonicus TaxID=270547 RepID=A0AAD3RF83_LATJO|nr:runt-related transcription factor 1-like protein [Lates japonicus]